MKGCSCRVSKRCDGAPPFEDSPSIVYCKYHDLLVEDRHFAAWDERFISEVAAYERPQRVVGE